MAKELRVLLATVLVLTLALAPAAVFAQAFSSPHTFFGTARLDGATVAAGTTITALVDGAAVATTQSTAPDAQGVNYVLQVQETAPGAFTGKTVTFRVGAAAARESAEFSAFASGRLDLSGLSAPAANVATQLQGISQQLQRAWAFDNATGRWKLYDPSAPAAANDLRSVSAGDAVVIVAREAGTLTTGTFTQPIRAGLNIFGWR